MNVLFSPRYLVYSAHEIKYKHLESFLLVSLKLKLKFTTSMSMRDPDETINSILHQLVATYKYDRCQTMVVAYSLWQTGVTLNIPPSTSSNYYFDTFTVTRGAQRFSEHHVTDRPANIRDHYAFPTRVWSFLKPRHTIKTR